MNIVFMGTPEFAATVLQVILADNGAKYNVPLVVTRPDSASGRGKTLLPSPVRAEAEAHGITVLQSRKADETFIDAVSAADPDFIVVAAFGLILPQAVLDLPRIACINIHASLLPRWRGAAPIQRAILAGDERAGVSIMRMETGLDTGDYCASADTLSTGKSATELIPELAHLGAELLLKTLPSIAEGSAQWVSQDESAVTYANKISKAELYLQPSLSAEENLRRVLASTAHSPARCVIAGRSVAVMEAELLSHSTNNNLEQGVVTLNPKGDKLVLGCAQGAIVVSRVKPDSKKAMHSRDFINGITRKGEADLFGWASMELQGNKSPKDAYGK